MVSRDGSQETLFYDDQLRQVFRGLTAELPDRFGLEVHAFLPMASLAPTAAFAASFDFNLSVNCLDLTPLPP